MLRDILLYHMVITIDHQSNLQVFVCCSVFLWAKDANISLTNVVLVELLVH